MSSRNNKYRLQIFKQLKRGNYIITPFNVYKKNAFSSDTYLNQYSFLADLYFTKDSAPLSCNDFYENGYDCSLLENGEGVVVYWIYGQSKLQNKGIYTIILTKSLSGSCNCLFLGYSNQINQSTTKPYIFNVSLGTFSDRSKFPLGKIPLGSVLYQNPSQSQSIDPNILYSYINHNFYKNNVDEDNYTAGYFLNKNINRSLFESCSVFNIRQDAYGNGIRRGSFVLNDFNLSGSFSESIKVYDDSNSNIIVSNITTASFVPYENLLLHLSFDEKFKERIENKKSVTPIKDYSKYSNNALTLSGSTYSAGFMTSGVKSEPVGTSLVCDGSVVYVNHREYLEFDLDSDFAISFFVSASISSQDTGSNVAFIIAKQEYSENFIKNKSSKQIDFKYLRSLTGVYPFSVQYITSGSDIGKIKLSRYGGTDEVFITSNTPITGAFQHIVCQKTGSMFQMFVNGTLNSSGSCNVNGSVYNTSPITIGSLFDGDSPFYGEVDELRIYDRALTNTEITALSNVDYINTQALQTNKIGNIFYNNGMVVLSTPIPAYKNLLLGLSGSFEYTSESGSFYGFSGSFESTKRIFQHEIVIPIKNHEFNFSSNPTLKKNNRSNALEFKPFVSSSFFNVYFTTIGLYNRNYELVAVAKLSTPMPKYQDKDLNIIVKFDVE